MKDPAEAAKDIEEALSKHEASRDLGYQAALQDIRQGLAALRDVDVGTIEKVGELLDRLEAEKKETP